MAVAVPHFTCPLRLENNVQQPCGDMPGNHVQKHSEEEKLVVAVALVRLLEDELRRS